jgi:hypothetical protein
MKSLFSNRKLLVLVTLLNLIVGCANKQNEVQPELVQGNRVCSPGSTKSQACSISNGSGTQMVTCNSNGSAFEKYGTCTVNRCNSGYFLSDGACLEQTCSPGSTKSQACSISNGAGTQMVTCNSNGSAVENYGACVANSCNIGYSLSYGVCTATEPDITAVLLLLMQ